MDVSALCTCTARLVLTGFVLLVLSCATDSSPSGDGRIDGTPSPAPTDSDLLTLPADLGPVDGEGGGRRPIYRVNCGGSAISDTPLAWSSDTDAVPFGSGGNSTANADSTSFQGFDPSVPTGTPESLFYTERYGSTTSYTFPVSSGTHTVRLYMAETFSGNQAVGARVMDVLMNGAVVLDDYDTYADVGGYTGVSKSVDVTTHGEPIAITMSATADNPRLQGIEVLSGASIPAPVAPTGVGASPGDQQVTLTWSDAVGADTYSVKRSTTSGGPYSTIAQDLTTTTHTDANLTNGTTYYYVVTASNQSGESGDSKQVSATPSEVTETVVWEMPLDQWGSGQITRQRLQASGLDLRWGLEASVAAYSDIIDDPVEPSGQKVLESRHEMQTSSTALQNDHFGFHAALPVDEDSLILEYDLAFGTGFMFDKPGGKLPGLAGSAIPTGNDGIGVMGCDPATGSGWSARNMWRQPGHHDNEHSPPRTQLMSYVYEMRKQSACGDNYSFDIPSPYLQTMRYYRIRQRVDINTVGQPDGRIRTWLDGVLVGDETGFEFRNTASYAINRLMWATYFGGATPEWGHERDEYFYFRNIRILRP